MTGRAQPVLDFFDEPQRYLAGNRAIPTRTRLVAELAGEVRGGRVVDLGCGDGSVSRQFLGRAAGLTLVDTSAKMLEMARGANSGAESGSVRYALADMLDVPEEQYELVLCIGVLAHVDSVEDALAKIARLTKPGGRCLLQLTDYGHPAGRLLHACHSLRLAFRPGGYPLNMISLTSITATCARLGLVAEGSRRYSFVPRRMGRQLPRRPGDFERRLRDHPILRRLGSEVIVSFVKS